MQWSRAVICLFCIFHFAGCEGGDRLGNEIPSGFEPGYYYWGGGEKRWVYLSLDVVTVKFAEDVTAEEGEALAREYGLCVLDDYYRRDPLVPAPGWTDLIGHPFIIMTLPAGARLEDYITHYPKTKGQRAFGNRRDVDFCMPSLSGIGNPDDIYYRIFMNDEISTKTTVDSTTLQELCAGWGLEIASRYPYDDHQYTLRLTERAEKSTLPMANELYERGPFVWAQPSFFVLYVLDG